MDRKAIGERLRKLRGTRTIQEVSDDTGIAWSNICCYELGMRMPNDDKKKILADYYKTTVQAIFFEDDIS